MEHSAENYEDWQTCLRYLPVNEQGDRDRQSGYLYDERDGTGVGYMDGIAVDRRRGWGREDYLFIHFSRAAACRNESPQPGGTAEPASLAGADNPRVARSSARPHRRYKRSLGPGPASDSSWRGSSARRPGCSRGPSDWRLSPSASTSGSRACRGCPSPDGRPRPTFGYLYGPRVRPATARRCTSTVADWEDPDYRFLALAGGTARAARVKTNQERH